MISTKLTVMKLPNIPGWPNYHISKTGRLYSNHSGSWVEIKPCFKLDGYAHNYLFKNENGKRLKKKFYRHRLVALVYIPNPEGKNQVCHKDNDKSNNRVSNLYWGTAKDNMQQCISDGRFFQVGEEHSKSVYSRINAKAIAKEYNAGKPRKDILRDWGISVGLLYKILRFYHIPLRVKRYGDS